MGKLSNCKSKSIILTMIVCGCAAAFCACSNDAETVVGKCEAAVKGGDYAGAVSIATGAIGQGTDDRALYRLRGIAELGDGQYDAAIGDFVETLNRSNGLIYSLDIDTSYYLATAEYKKGDYDTCIGTLTAISNIRPKEDRAYYLRGKVELAKGDKTSAMVDFDKALALAPTNYDYYVGMYEELAGAGYETEGKEYLEKAISQGGKMSDYNKGVIEYCMGSYTDARNDLENAKKSGENENLILYLAKTYEALGDYGYAQNILETYALANQDSSKVFGELAYLKLTQKDYEGALSTIETGLSGNGMQGRRGLMFNRVVAYEYTYDFANAKTAMEEYLKQYPDDKAALRENVFLSSR